MAAPMSSEGIVTDSYKTYRDTYRITYQILQYVSFVEKVYRYTPNCIVDGFTTSLHVQSVPITTNVVSTKPINGEVFLDTTLCDKVCH